MCKLTSSSRRGAPFRLRISRMMQRLVEGGLIDYWLDDIIAIHIRKKSRKIESGESKGQEDNKLLEVHIIFFSISIYQKCINSRIYSIMAHRKSN